MDQIPKDSIVLSGFRNHADLLADMHREYESGIYTAEPPSSTKEVYVRAIGFFTEFTNPDGIGLPVSSAHQVFEEARAALLETMFLIAHWGANLNTNNTVNYENQIFTGFHVLKNREEQSSADYSAEHRAAGVIWEYLQNNRLNGKFGEIFQELINILTRSTFDEFLDRMRETPSMHSYFGPLLKNRGDYVDKWNH